METVQSDSMQAACASVWVGTGRSGEEPVLPLQHLKSGDLSHTQTYKHTHTYEHPSCCIENPSGLSVPPSFYSPLRNPPCLNQPVFCPSLVNLQPKCLLSCLQANPRPLSGREAACSTQPVEVSVLYGFIKVWEFDGNGKQNVSLHVYFSSYIQYFSIFLCRFLLTFEYYVANVQGSFSNPASA